MSFWDKAFRTHPALLPCVSAAYPPYRPVETVNRGAQMNDQFLVTKELVRKILERAAMYEWTLQGFGWLRCYLGKVGRIHVWDSRYRTPNVSMIHNHAWPLASTVISGCMRNTRFTEFDASGDVDSLAREYGCATIQTGEGGGMLGRESSTFLAEMAAEVYFPGASYAQTPEEIHLSDPLNGTVTLVARPEGEGAKTARVFWPVGEEWVSAEPRPPTLKEVNTICSAALEVWA